MTCQGGVVTLSRQTCRWNWPSGDGQNDDDDETCHHLLAPRPGECCPRCKTCQWINNNNNNVTIIGQGRSAVSPDPQKEPCTQCQCSSNDSSMICTRQTCPVLPCPANKALLQPGACCPICQGVRKEIIPSSSSSSSSGNICQIGKKTFEFGAQFRPDPCTNCTCQSNSTTVCVRDNSRRHCPNVHPATITVPPPPPPSSSTESSPAVVDSFQRQQEASSSSSTTSMKATIQMMMPTALPASRPLTCAYRGVTYQVKYLELQFNFTHTKRTPPGDCFKNKNKQKKRFDDVVDPTTHFFFFFFRCWFIFI